MVRKVDTLRKYPVRQLRAAARSHNAKVREGSSYLKGIDRKKKAELVTFLAKNHTVHVHAQGHRVKNRYHEFVLRKTVRRPPRRRAVAPIPASIPGTPVPSPVRPPPRRPPPTEERMQRTADQLSLADRLFALNTYRYDVGPKPLARMAQAYANSVGLLKDALTHSLKQKNTREIAKYKYLIKTTRDQMKLARAAAKVRGPARNRELAPFVKKSWPESRTETWKNVKRFLHYQP